MSNISNTSDESDQGAVSIASSPPDHDVAELFCSGDPRLNELLKRRRVRICSKSHHPEIAEPSSVDVGDMQKAKK